MIRQLGVYKEQVPNVELFQNGGSWTGGWRIAGNTGPHNRMFGWDSVIGDVLIWLVCWFGASTTLYTAQAGKITISPSALTLRGLLYALPLTVMALLIGLFAFLRFHCFESWRGRHTLL